jgi:aminoglycoside 6'-N-acetyltransferase
MLRHDYRFVRVIRADYPMLRHWLAEPHVAAFWGDPDTEIALIDEEVDGGDCNMHVVWSDRPFAFVQDWGVHDYGAPHFRDTPPGTRGVDTFLGETAYHGKGHAKAYIRQYARALIASGAPMVVTDPSPDNLRAIAMWRGAGFLPGETRPSETGEPALCMTFHG